MAVKNQNPASHHVKSDFLRWILIGCGWVFVLAGVVGIFLPIVPTVPFRLLAAVCFGKSSPRFHAWLIEHNHLGPLIRDYLHGGGIPLRAKRLAIGMVWVSFPSSALLLREIQWLSFLLIALAAAITLYLLRLPTTPPEEHVSNRTDTKP